MTIVVLSMMFFSVIGAIRFVKVTYKLSRRYLARALLWFADKSARAGFKLNPEY